MNLLGVHKQRTRVSLDANDASQMLFAYEKAEIVIQCDGRRWMVV